MDAIEVKNLTKKYGSKVAVDNLNIHVKKGEVFGLLGANGAGKSTTIECILVTKNADNGTVDEAKKIRGCKNLQFSIWKNNVFQRKSHLLWI